MKLFANQSELQGNPETDKTSEYTQNAGCPGLTLTHD